VDEADAGIELPPPPMPRLRPSRPADPTGTADAGGLDLSLPTESRPLTIRQP